MPLAAADHDTQALVVMRFSRDPAILHERLQQAMSKLGLKWRLPSGAYAFVPQDLIDTVHTYVEEESIQLGPGHVLVVQELEDEVMQIVHKLPRKYQVSVESYETLTLEKREPVHAEEDEVNEMDVPHGLHNVILVQRSFIHILLPSSLRSEPSGRPRTVSSSDAAPRAPQNPRSFVKHTV